MPSMPILPAAPPHGKPLFWKILVVILVTAVLGTAAMGVYFKFILQDSYNSLLRQQAASYIRMIADGIGLPADTAAARSLTLRYPFEIRIESSKVPGQRGGLVWTSEPTLPAVQTLLDATYSNRFDSDDSIRIRKYEGERYAVIDRNGWNYLMRFRSPTDDAMLFPATGLFCVVLILLFVAAYYAVERFLLPVKELMEGVQAVGAGNFNYQVPVCSNDELGELTHAFNSMSQHVAAIIASKRRLLFDVSHELRTPLTRMNVALAMLPEGKAKISIERNIRELNIMITELLENERLAVLGGSLVVETVDVVALARDVIETFGHDARRLEFDTLTESLEITADTQRLKVALRNVISNALKYSTDTTVKVTVFPDDHGARVVIADQGIGISAEEKEKVFEPFYRTDDSRSRLTGGYGLGLSLTKAIVEAHGGTIRIDSTPGVGTTIMMWLPNAPASEAVAQRMTAQVA